MKTITYWKNTNYLDFNFLDFSLTEAQNFIHNISPNSQWEFVTPSAKATLAAVMYSVYQCKNKSFQESILKALSLGGDTDSVASLVGALIGFHNSSIPPKWSNIIHDQGNYKQDYLIDLSKKLYQQARKP